MVLKMTEKQLRESGIVGERAEVIGARSSGPALKSGQMNRLERDFLEENIKYWVETGHVVAYWHEAMKFRLAHKTFYTPDFMLQTGSGEMQIIECKGFMRDDAAVKIKVVASMYPFRVFLARRAKGQGWTLTEVKAHGGG